MFTPKLLALGSAVLGLVGLAVVACGEDEANVRPRLDGTGDGGGTSDGATTEAGALGCGATLPASFVSPNFASNAAVELALGDRVRELDTAMANTEGPSVKTETKESLGAIFDGTPSLRRVASAFTQTTVDGYLDAFGAAGGKYWAPADAEADGGAATGGKYGVLFYESRIGVDLRAATGKTLLAGALYNHVVLDLLTTPVTDVTIDRMLASFGASTALANRTDVDAGADGDRLLAELASKRDNKSVVAPGIYRRMRNALLKMKAAVAAGEACNADRDAAVAAFLLEWEHATYASAIFSLNAAITTAPDKAKGPQSLHAYGDALGLIQSFKGIPADKRHITDRQIDDLLLKIGADTPYKLVTEAGTRVLALNGAINDIALYEVFDAAAVEEFKKSF